MPFSCPANQTLQRRRVSPGGTGRDGRTRRDSSGETRDQSERIAERQPFAQIRLNTGRGRGSQRQAGRIGEFLAKAADFEIIGPEIVTPLGNAMRFVDHQQRNPEGAQSLEKPLMLHPFRRQIEQLEPLLIEILNTRFFSEPGEAGVKRRRRDRSAASNRPPDLA